MISSDAITEGTYQVYNGETQLSHSGMMMGMGGGRPKMPNGEMPEDGKLGEGEMPQMPEGSKFGEGEMPQMEEGERPQMPNGGKFTEGEAPQRPENDEVPAIAEGDKPQMPNGGLTESGEKSTDFTVEKGVNFFGGVAE